MILFIKHIDIEGPGTIETFFDEQGFQSKTIDLSRGEILPSDLADIEAVISLGGPMNVYEEDKYSWLSQENLFIQRILKEEIPFLGICLGSQLLAKACGAKVGKSPVKEVGWYKVKIDFADQLFNGVGNKFDVYHWHEDMFDIPANGIRIATGDGCPNQAFKVGKFAYGIQFHVEVTERIIADWCKAYLKSDDEQKRVKAKEMLDLYAQKKILFDQTSKIIYQNFTQLIHQKAR